MPLLKKPSRTLQAVCAYWLMSSEESRAEAQAQHASRMPANLPALPRTFAMRVHLNPVDGRGGVGLWKDPVLKGRTFKMALDAAPSCDKKTPAVYELLISHLPAGLSLLHTRNSVPGGVSMSYRTLTLALVLL